jgi:hypothetical protein
MKSFQKRFSAWGLIAIAIFVATQAQACPIEKEWGLDRELKEWFADWDLGSFRQAHVIAWKAQVDKRPLYVEECIGVVERKKGWVLVKLNRHPQEKRGWELAIVYDAGQTPYRVYNQKPTKAELISFLKSSWWSFEPSGGYRLVQSGICEDTLQNLFGNTTANELKQIHQPPERR